MFASASYVSFMSPYSNYQEEVLPLLGGPIALAIVFVSVTRLDWNILAVTNINWNALTVHAARLN